MNRITKKLGRGAAFFAVGTLIATAAAQGLAPQPAQVLDFSDQPAAISSPGQLFKFIVPLHNITSSTQTNVVGVSVPVSPDITIIGPAAGYGDIAASATANGSAYVGQLGTSVTLQRSYTVKLGVKSDQEEVDFPEIKLPGATGFGDGTHIAAWPLVGFGGVEGVTISADAGASDRDLYVNSTAGLMNSTVLRNTRTGELVHLSSIDASTGHIQVRRSQFGTVAPSPMAAGDTLVFEGVAIPDAISAGVPLKVNVAPVAGAVGPIRVHIDEIVHPHVSDLMITLEAKYTSGTEVITTSSILMGPIDGGLGNGANISDISFADNGTTEADALTGPPVAGTVYQPVDSLDNFAALDGATLLSWTVRISDIAAPTVGYIKGGWSIDVNQ